MKIKILIFLLLMACTVSASDIKWTSVVAFAADSGGAIEDDADTVTAKFIDTAYSAVYDISDYEIVKLNWSLEPEISVGTEDTFIIRLQTALYPTGDWLYPGCDSFIILPGTNDTSYRAMDIECDSDSLLNYVRARSIYWIDNVPATMEDTAAGETYTQTLRIWFTKRFK